MKKVLFILIASIALVSCTSREDKIEDLIKSHLFSTLDDFDSFEFVSMEVDSSFASIYNDEQAILWGMEFRIILSDLTEKSNELDLIKKRMDIWRNSSTIYGVNEYTNARKEYDECMKYGRKQLERLSQLSDSVKVRKSNIPENEFIGWKVNYKFRSKNKDGNTMLSEKIFIIDREISKINAEYDKEDNTESERFVEINMALNYDDRNNP